MRTHQNLDKRSLALHCLVAEKIRRDPSLFEKPKEVIKRWSLIVSPHSQPYLREWEKLLDQGMDACLAVATEDSERAAALRQSSPFVGILSNAERQAFFREWAQILAEGGEPPSEPTPTISA